jgi:hypothetical protein
VTYTEGRSKEKEVNVKKMKVRDEWIRRLDDDHVKVMET